MSERGEWIQCHNFIWMPQREQITFTSIFMASKKLTCPQQFPIPSFSFCHFQIQIWLTMSDQLSWKWRCPSIQNDSPIPKIYFARHLCVSIKKKRSIPIQSKRQAQRGHWIVISRIHDLGLRAPKHAALFSQYWNLVAETLVNIPVSISGVEH